MKTDLFHLPVEEECFLKRAEDKKELKKEPKKELKKEPKKTQRRSKEIISAPEPKANPLPPGREDSLIGLKDPRSVLRDKGKDILSNTINVPRDSKAWQRAEDIADVLLKQKYEKDLWGGKLSIGRNPAGLGSGIFGLGFSKDF